MKTRRSARLLAAVTVASLVVAACGGDDDDSADPTTPPAPTTAAPEPTTAPTDAPEPTTAPTDAPEPTTAPTEPTDDTTPTTEAPAPSGGGMTVTYTLSDVAVWSNGEPFSAADFQCVVDAAAGTPGAYTTAGYDQVVDVREGASPQEVVVEFGTVYAAWRGLFNGLLQASQHENCSDVSEDFQGTYTYGAGPYTVTEWTPEQAVWEKNPNYVGQYTEGPDRIVIVPAEDAATALKSGSIDFAYPQAFTGIDAELADPNVTFAAEPGGQFEAFYFQQDDLCEPNETRSCAFADDTYRAAFAKHIDLDAVYAQIYAPFAQGIPLLQCGPIAPGPYCDPIFDNPYDPEGGVALLEEAGWTLVDGFWTNPDGEVPEVHFSVSAPNPRREGTQEFLIPQLTAAGFKVIADNCEATPCFFQNRLPALQYDFSMFINTVAPDPGYLTAFLAADQVPSEDNGFAGGNLFGWRNEEATALLYEADQTLDVEARADLVKQALALLPDEYALLPLLQFPNVGAWRTDKVAGVDSNLANYWAFQDWWNFEDLDGDGTVVIGAEQYVTPDCINPVTECSASSWFQWTAGFPNFPAVYWPTNDQTFVPSEFLVGEAVAEEL